MYGFYDKHADALCEQYDALEPSRIHAGWISKVDTELQGFACDIGSGSGRDANWLAGLGWDVIAVEPSAAMRARAKSRSHSNVTWLNDSLPDLIKLRAIGHRFDLILLSAVWMHVPPSSRERAFRIVTELLKPGGQLVITLRHGSDAKENESRGFYPCSLDEIQALARQRAVAVTHREEQTDSRRSHVHWESVVLAIPDDGTGSLPILRHIIVNDSKSASYKLGLLRVLTRIAEGAPGVVIGRTEDYVDIPLGVVGLYWLKQYKPLLLRHGVPQHANRNQGYGFAKEAFHQLEHISSYDLRIGARFDHAHASIVTEAIRDACRNITQMPARYITWPGRSEPVFLYDWKTIRKTQKPIVLSPDFLERFGTFRVPAKIWQTLGQYACWLEPAIIREWQAITDGWRIGEPAVSADVFAWEEGRRDTRIAAERVASLKRGGADVRCVWTAKTLGAPHIDHCFPWSRWLNNDLWNLLPTRAEINLNKADRLPAASTLATSHDRILDWWQDAYIDSAYRERFHIEASASLPGLSDRPTSAEIYQALLHQRARLRSDQQLAEWVAR